MTTHPRSSPGKNLDDAQSQQTQCRWVRIKTFSSQLTKSMKNLSIGLGGVFLAADHGSPPSTHTHTHTDTNTDRDRVLERSTPALADQIHKNDFHSTVRSELPRQKQLFPSSVESKRENLPHDTLRPGSIPTESERASIHPTTCRTHSLAILIDC